MADSFYAGKPGISFVIRETFGSVDEMRKAFAKGADYIDVWYDEYCLISTKNKNHFDNGKIFKRGLDYLGEMNGAIYVGQIVGPSSGTPYFQVNSIEATKQKALTPADGETVHKRYPYGMNEDRTYKIKPEMDANGNELLPGPGNDIATFECNVDNGMIVPGRYIDENGQEQFNDNLRYTWVNIREDDNDADSWFYVGFQIPYVVNDYEIHTVDQYDDDGNFIVDSATLEKIEQYDEDGDVIPHPFFEHWDFGIPKGIKGDTLRNLHVATYDEYKEDDYKVYPSSAITIDPVTGNATLDESQELSLTNEKEHEYEIVVFDYYIFDKEVNPEPVHIYLGQLNSITGVDLDDDGTLTVHYTAIDNDVFERKIKWITGAILTTGDGENGGHFELDFNNGDDPFEVELTWVKGIEIQENGTVVYTHAGTDEGKLAANGVKTVEKLLKWIDEVNLDVDNGHLKVTYNNESKPFEADLDWIKRIVVDDDGTVHFIHTVDNADEISPYRLNWVSQVDLDRTNGVFTITFNDNSSNKFYLDWIDAVDINEENGEISLHHTGLDPNDPHDPIGDEILDARLKLITKAAISTNGVLTFTLNTNQKDASGKDIVDASGNPVKETLQATGRIKWLDDVNLSTDITEDQRISVKFNTESARYIGSPINYIKDMKMNTADWHLHILFSDPTHRVTAADLDADSKDSQGYIWRDNNWMRLNVDNTIPNYGASVYWKDFGPIKDQAGVLIGMNLTEDMLDPSLTVVESLNILYPLGLTGEENSVNGQSLKGKIITVGGTNDEKSFYAYDSNAGTWFFLGTIADDNKRDVVMSFTQVPTAADNDKLHTDGIFVIATQSTYADEGTFPRFWAPEYGRP